MAKTGVCARMPAQRSAKLLVERAKASHLITLLQDEILVERPHGILPERHLRLRVHDIS